jgi:prepilin-type N-terminal cleavage/methylation domain-containing protein
MAKRNRKGFTLIELLVVIAVIAILAAVIIASTGNARVKARDARRLSDLDQLANAILIYYDKTSTYPANLSALAPDYISTVPVDPTNSTPTSCTYTAEIGASATCYGYDKATTASGIPVFCVEATTEGTVTGPAKPSGWTGLDKVTCGTAGTKYCICR